MTPPPPNSSLKPKLRIGIVGAGKIASEMHVPVLCSMPDVVLSWILDADAKRADAVARAFGTTAPASLGDAPPVDVVLLAIPLQPRSIYFEQLAKFPSAILAEKPLALNSDAHAGLLQVFDPWRLSVGFQRRGYATSRFLKSVLQEQIFGAPQRIRIREGARTTKTSDYGAFQDLSAKLGGGVTKNLGCHSLDLALWSFGADRYSLISNAVAWDGETDRRAAAVVTLRRAGPAPAECELDWEVSWLDYESNTIEVFLPSVTVVVPISPSPRARLLDGCGNKIAEIDLSETGGATSIEQAFFLEWRSVIEGVAARQPTDYSGASCLLGARLIDDILRR